MKPIPLKPHPMNLNTIDELLADMRAGKMVVLMDDEDRENEGDLIIAAEHVRAEDINFMAHYGRGLICLTLTRERCRQLRLPLMVSDTNVDHRTNFTVSIEAAEGVTTGISAHDRAHTIRTAVRRDARAEDLRQPGHIFPLMAQPGGVLTRAGHTEAGCDLTRLAGLEPAAAIVEILNDDGTMARRPDLEKFAQRHHLKMGTIADLIRYRLDKERSVERIAEQVIATEFGAFRMFCYEDHVNRTVHLALVAGDLEDKRVPLVRVHLKDTLGDVVAADVRQALIGGRVGGAHRDQLEGVDRPGLAVDGEDEVVGREARDGPPVLVHDDRVDRDELDAGAEHGLLRMSGQGHDDEGDGENGHPHGD